MKRLVKQSIMNIEMFKGTLNQLSDEGRDILKLIEDYKFKLDQTCRLTANDQQLTQKLVQKRKQLDVASGQIYSIVFDIDNIDITQAYEQQQINTNPNMPVKNDVNKPAPTPTPSSSKEEPEDDDEKEDNKEEPIQAPSSGGGVVPPANNVEKGEESTEEQESDSNENVEEENNNGNEEQ